MDFFSHQEAARKRSRSLLWRFVLANLLLAGLLSFALLALGAASDDQRHSSQEYQYRYQPSDSLTGGLPVVLVLDLFVILTVSTAAFVRFRSLSSSGGAVAEALGGRKVSPETSDPLERRYLNVVEEMAIAANTPVPEIYILSDEEGINAFASGPSPEHSAVAVTRGALERLSRDELQGVVAHEFSHILHGDVRLNIRLAGYIYGLVILSAIGRFVLRLAADSGRSRRSKDRGGAALVIAMIGLFFLIFGLLGRLVSVLMSAAVSREREYLADATAVQLTRNPDGIAGALKKIGGFSNGAAVESVGAEGLSHFFLAERKAPGFFERLYASHPPLDERIRRIDASFNGELPDDEQIGIQTCDESLGVSLLTSTSARAVGAVHSEWLPPPELHSAIVGIGSAEAVVCSVLLSHENPTMREAQVKLLSGWIPASEMERQEAAVSKLSVSQQVSAVFMALPTVQLGSRERRAAFRGAVVEMTRADGSVSLLEFLVTVLVYLGTQDTDAGFSMRGSSTRKGLTRLTKPVGNFLSVCSLFASQDDATRQRLFSEAASRLKLPLQFEASADRDIPLFIKSLESLRETSPRARKGLMDALHEMVLADGVVSELEVALLRVFSVLLRTELPPVAPSAEGVAGRVQGV